MKHSKMTLEEMIESWEHSRKFREMIKTVHGRARSSVCFSSCFDMMLLDSLIRDGVIIFNGSRWYMNEDLNAYLTLDYL